MRAFRAAAATLASACLLLTGSVASASGQPLTLQQIRAQVQHAGGAVVEALPETGGELVEAKFSGLIRFIWYDLASGHAYPLPAGYFTQVKVVQVLGPTDITLLNLGTVADGSMWPFPFEYRCTRANSTSAFACETVDVYFPVTTAVRFGSKPNEVLTEVVYTVDGVEVAFGPERGRLDEFWADYTYIPPVRTGFDSANHTFTLTFQDAVPAHGLKLPRGGNTFIRSTSLRAAGRNLVLSLALRPTVARYFTGTVEWGPLPPPPFLELRFSPQNW